MNPIMHGHEGRNYGLELARGSKHLISLPAISSDYVDNKKRVEADFVKKLHCRQFDVRDINDSSKRFKKISPIQDYTAGFKKNLHDSSSPENSKNRGRNDSAMMQHVLLDEQKVSRNADYMVGQNPTKKHHKLPDMNHIAGVRAQYDEGMRDVIY